MGMKKALIIGANGLIGYQLLQILTHLGVKCVGTTYKRSTTNSLTLNILDKAQIQQVLQQVKPDTVFCAANLAGGVNFCEKNPLIAHQFHVEATQNIGTWCQANRSQFIFISTDYVFDGKKESPYSETDTPNPLNLYGKLKLEAENWILENLDHYLIGRTTNVYGFDPQTVTPNFLMSLWIAQQKQETKLIPSYLYGNPTFAPELARVLIELVQNEQTGIFHMVGTSFVNRYEWAMKIGQLVDWDLSLLKEDPHPPSSFEVPRPLLSNLNTEKYRNICSQLISDIDTGATLFKQQIDHYNAQG